MPEGDTIFRAARTLNRALAGQTVTEFESVLPKLSRVDFDSGIVGRTVDEVTAHGKWISINFSGGLTLLTHMLMSGSWHIYRPGERWQRREIDMRIVVKTEKIWAVAFNVPIAEFHTADTLRRRPGFNSLGQDVLAEEFDPQQSMAALRSRGDVEVGAALLMQSVMAGLGNVFKSEVCFACEVNPFRLVKDLSIEEISCLVTTSRKFLLANVSENSGDEIVTYTGMRRTTGRANREERLWVYGRRGEPCRKCGTLVESKKQNPDARTTFWCPQCQPVN
ncbi:MAG TPA: DNA-formamidopyrimidine glycosylase family protein [Terriglobales bacterium]|jgi:endonuclease-8|nr:DNA-formamidopyrimidine glycosylase family protein [Terriglobales bacterium]